MNIVDHNLNMALRFAEFLFYTMPTFSLYHSCTFFSCCIFVWKTCHEPTVCAEWEIDLVQMLPRDCTHQDKNLMWVSWRQMRVKVWSWEFLLSASPVATDYPTIVKAKLWPLLVRRQTTQTLHRGLPLSLRRYVHVCFSRFPSMLLTQETERSTAEGRFLWRDLYQLCNSSLSSWGGPSVSRIFHIWFEQL